MPDYNYTPAQRDAIDYRGGNVLVSAAAGSGKTSVLSERVTALVEKEKSDIKRMLVVTFTNKAAQEMKKRIRRRLAERSEKTEEARLAIQSEITESSDICTIHSFSGKIIREHFSVLDLPSNIHSTSDETINVYRSESYEQMLEYFYENDDSQFLKIRDRFSGRDEKNLISIISKAYDFARSQPDGLDWIKEHLDIDVSAYVEIGKEIVRNNLLRLQAVLEESVELTLDEKFPERQLLNDQADLKTAEQLLGAFEGEEYEEYRKILSDFSIPNVFVTRKNETVSDRKTDLTALKTEARNIIKELKKNPPDEIEKKILAEAPVIKENAEGLYHILKKYHEIYSEVKRSHHVMDYDDMLHFAYEILKDDSIAEKYSNSYDYVFIDEYQDTNPLQEALLNRIRPRGGRFMVGDMKQSIYRFRLTDPYIFRSKTERKEDIHLVKMNENFRSGYSVIDFVNHSMGNLMSPDLGEIIYDEEEKLIAPVRETGETGVELMLTSNDGETELQKAKKEALNIAGRIRSLLSEKNDNGDRKYTEKDICILMRSMKYAQTMVSVLRKQGIDVRLSSEEESTLASDIYLNLLKVVDGFTSDIALLSVMKSFIGEFNEDDFARIRGESPEGSFSEAFLRFTGKDDELGLRCKAFYERIQTYRRWAKTMALDDFLIRIKNNENFDANIFLLPNGAEKKNAFDNYFTKMMDWAKDKNSLYELLYYLRKMDNSYETGKKKEESLGAVRIMTIHGAKGLEFPVVILARLSAKFSDSDLNDRFFFHNTLGISMNFVDEVQRRKIKSYVRSIGDYAQRKEQLSEEMRVLYVAMTRAKEKLILSGCVKDIDALLGTGVRNWYDLFNMKTFMEWIVSSIGDLRCMNDWTHSLSKNDDAEVIHYFADFEESEELMENGESPDWKEMIGNFGKQEFVSYTASKVPVTISVSKLLPKDEAGVYLPSFEEYEDRGAELGTIIHHFMEKIDFSIDSMEDLSSHGDRLVEKGIMFQDELDRVKPFYERILGFLRSDIAEEIRNSSEVLREVQFSLLIRGSDIGEENSDEKVILHGIIDLAYRSGDEYVVLDYKSNLVDDSTMDRLAQHYEVQMKMYREALEKIRGCKVRNCYLWFIRTQKEYKVF